MGSKNAQAVKGLILGASPQEIEQFKDLLRFFSQLAMTTGFRIGARLLLAALLTRHALRPLSVATDFSAAAPIACELGPNPLSFE